MKNTSKPVAYTFYSLFDLTDRNTGADQSSKYMIFVESSITLVSFYIENQKQLNDIEMKRNSVR